VPPDLADDDVELVVFKRGIEFLFEHRLKAMNLVQKEHLALTQIRKDRRKIALNLPVPAQRSAGSLHLVRLAMMEAESCLAQSGRPKEQNMIERLAARLSRFERQWPTAPWPSPDRRIPSAGVDGDFSFERVFHLQREQH